MKAKRKNGKNAGAYPKFTMTLNVTPEMIGKTMRVVMLAKFPAGTGGTVTYWSASGSVAGQSANLQTITTGSFAYHHVFINIVSGTTFVSVTNIHNFTGSTDPIEIAALQVSVGNEVVRYLPPTKPKFTVSYDSAAPTVGTWAVGDRVINSVPTVGQPKSWVCTVAGTPGTWTSEGNL